MLASPTAHTCACNLPVLSSIMHSFLSVTNLYMGCNVDLMIGRGSDRLLTIQCICLSWAPWVKRWVGSLKALCSTHINWMALWYCNQRNEGCFSGHGSPQPSLETLNVNWENVIVRHKWWRKRGITYRLNLLHAMVTLHLAKYGMQIKIPHCPAWLTITHIPSDLNFAVTYLDSDSSNMPKILSLVYKTTGSPHAPQKACRKLTYLVYSNSDIWDKLREMCLHVSLAQIMEFRSKLNVLSDHAWKVRYSYGYQDK